MEQLSYQKLTKRQRAATVLAQPWHFVFGNNSPLMNLARRSDRRSAVRLRASFGAPLPTLRYINVTKHNLYKSFRMKKTALLPKSIKHWLAP
jgi:hypothetical protein